MQNEHSNNSIKRWNIHVSKFCADSYRQNTETPSAGASERQTQWQKATTRNTKIIIINKRAACEMWQNNRKNIFTRPFWRSLEREKNCCQYRKSHLLKHHRNTQHNMRAFLISLKCRVVCSLHSSHREANQWATIYLQTHERCRGGIQNEHYISR